MKGERGENMVLTIKKDLPESRGVWIISGGRYVDLDVNGIVKGVKPKFVKEYRISQLARHLLNP